MPEPGEYATGGPVEPGSIPLINEHGCTGLGLPDRMPSREALQITMHLDPNGLIDPARLTQWIETSRLKQWMAP